MVGVSVIRNVTLRRENIETKLGQDQVLDILRFQFLLGQYSKHDLSLSYDYRLLTEGFLLYSSALEPISMTATIDLLIIPRSYKLLVTSTMILSVIILHVISPSVGEYMYLWNNSALLRIINLKICHISNVYLLCCINQLLLFVVADVYLYWPCQPHSINILLHI